MYKTKSEGTPRAGTVELSFLNPGTTQGLDVEVEDFRNNTIRPLLTKISHLISFEETMFEDQANIFDFCGYRIIMIPINRKQFISFYKMVYLIPYYRF